MVSVAGARKKLVHVCRDCHRVVEGESCAVCGSANLSSDWTGYIVIIDPRHSEEEKKMNISLPGRYALKVR